MAKIYNHPSIKISDASSILKKAQYIRYLLHDKQKQTPKSTPVKIND